MIILLDSLLFHVDYHVGTVNKFGYDRAYYLPKIHMQNMDQIFVVVDYVTLHCVLRVINRRTIAFEIQKNYLKLFRNDI